MFFAFTSTLSASSDMVPTVRLSSSTASAFCVSSFASVCDLRLVSRSFFCADLCVRVRVCANVFRFLQQDLRHSIRFNQAPAMPSVSVSASARGEWGTPPHPTSTARAAAASPSTRRPRQTQPEHTLVRPKINRQLYVTAHSKTSFLYMHIETLRIVCETFLH